MDIYLGKGFLAASHSIWEGELSYTYRRGEGWQVRIGVLLKGSWQSRCGRVKFEVEEVGEYFTPVSFHQNKQHAWGRSVCMGLGLLLDGHFDSPTYLSVMYQTFE